MNQKERFVRELRKKRFEYGHTQEQAAELLNISTRHFQDLENGRSLPGFKSICQLADKYKMDFAMFVEDEEGIG